MFNRLNFENLSVSLGMSRPIHKFRNPNLNNEQKEVIEKYVKSALHILTESLTPPQAIGAMETVLTGSTIDDNFRGTDVYKTLLTLVQLMLHDYPQNKSQGDPAAARIALQDLPEGVQLSFKTLFNRTLLSKGILGNKVYYFDTDNAVQYEPLGILDLVSKNNSHTPHVTKEAVREYTTHLITVEMHRLKTCAHIERQESAFMPWINVTKKVWTVSMTIVPNKIHYYLYLEGIKSNGQYFIERFGLELTSERKAFVETKRLTTDDRFDIKSMESYQITSSEGRILKDNIESDSGAEINLIKYTRYRSSLFIANDFCSREWALDHLRAINKSPSVDNAELLEPMCRFM